MGVIVGRLVKALLQGTTLSDCAASGKHLQGRPCRGYHCDSLSLICSGVQVGWLPEFQLSMQYPALAVGLPVLLA